MARVVKGREVTCLLFLWEMGKRAEGGGFEWGKEGRKAAEEAVNVVILEGQCCQAMWSYTWLLYKSCSSLVSLRGVIKNPTTCMKALYILHSISFALAWVWRAELCNWPPTPWPSTALSRDAPGCFSRVFSAGQGRMLLRPRPWLLLLGLATLSLVGAKALGSLLTRITTITCGCPSLVNVCACV